MLACLRPYTVKHVYILILRRSSSCTRCLGGQRVQCRLPTWSWDDWSWSTLGNLLFVCYRSSMVGCPQAVQIKFRSQRWLRSLQVMAMHKWHLIVRISAHDYSVKLSSCICSHNDSSCDGCWLMWYLDIYLCVTNPALCDDKLVSQCAARSGSPRDDKSPH